MFKNIIKFNLSSAEPSLISSSEEDSALSSKSLSNTGDFLQRKCIKLKIKCLQPAYNFSELAGLKL